MKLRMLNTGSSPYAVRCRMVMYAKGLDIDYFDPPGGLGTSRYKALHPYVKVPTLWINDDDVLLESYVICEYLDDVFPSPPLKPKDPRARAQMNLLATLADHYIMDHMMQIFPQRDPSIRDQSIVKRCLDGLTDGFNRLEYFMGEDKYAVGSNLTLADCVIMPILYLVEDFLPLYDAPSPLSTRPRLARYWRDILKDKIVKRVHDEMASTLKGIRAKRVAEEASVSASVDEQLIKKKQSITL